MSKKSYKKPIYKPSWDIVETWASDTWTTINAASWAQNVTTICAVDSRVSANGAAYTSGTTKIRVKHIEVDVQLPILEPGVVARAAIMYIPEKYTWTTNSNVGSVNDLMTTSHPEWVMGVKTVTNNEGGGNLVAHITSGRLQRKLNAGDRVALVVEVINNSATATGFLRWVACSRYAVCSN